MGSAICRTRLALLITPSFNLKLALMFSVVSLLFEFDSDVLSLFLGAFCTANNQICAKLCPLRFKRLLSAFFQRKSAAKRFWFLVDGTQESAVTMFLKWQHWQRGNCISSRGERSELRQLDIAALVDYGAAGMNWGAYTSSSGACNFLDFCRRQFSGAYATHYSVRHDLLLSV